MSTDSRQSRASVAALHAAKSGYRPDSGIVRRPRPDSGIVRRPRPDNGIVRRPRPDNGISGRLPIWAGVRQRPDRPRALSPG